MGPQAVPDENAKVCSRVGLKRSKGECSRGERHCG